MTNAPVNEVMGFPEAKLLGSEALRLAIRGGRYCGHTAGLAPGKLQANLVILPTEYALDFMRFCQRNSQACPLVGVSDTGDYSLPTLARDLDLRTDLPGYNVYRNGQLSEQKNQIADLWRDDMVAFALGCSFTFERALMREGLELQHIAQNKTVPMYKTKISCARADAFHGNLVVSMRAIPSHALEKVRGICAQYPHAHGEPVHSGDPSSIGISDIGLPDWGDSIDVPAGSIPVFWACGVTSQNALFQAKPEICITHTPGQMLVTDIPEDLVPPVLPDH